MKGTAQSLPTNHVVWANGFKSNMPDWPTARRCAVSDRMAYLLREMRSLFFEIERQNIEIVKDPRWSVLLSSCQDVLGFVDLGIDVESRGTFPKPPGLP